MSNIPILTAVAHGIPLGVVVDGANRHDMKLTEATLNAWMVERPVPTPQSQQGLCLDKGYDFDEVRELLASLGFTVHLRSRGEDKCATLARVSVPACCECNGHSAFVHVPENVTHPTSAVLREG